jgi:uncharacterized protein (DUF1015 family)
MPRFEPFAGVRYDTDRVALADVTAPPYDVISDDDRAELAARSPYNAVHIDCPGVPGAGPDCYRVAADRYREWRRDGVLQTDDQPSLYVYRMTFTDERGQVRSTIGVIGALGLEEPGTGDVLPHERTTPKAKSDRLELLRATQTNLSSVWGLSLAEGLSKLVDPAGAAPLGAWLDDAGVHHELWRTDDAAAIDAVVDAVAGSPVVIADGHHRYETCLVYRTERPDLSAAGATMAWIVELAEDQLAVGAIHRLIAGLPDDFDFLAALSPFFALEDLAPGDSLAGLTERMDEAGALALVHAHGTALLRPRPDAFAGIVDLDSARLDVALAKFPPHSLTFQHGADRVAAAVASGAAQAAVLLRPVSVAQIADVAHRRDRMPPKTTFFQPKPRTGLVFRPLD